MKLIIIPYLLCFGKDSAEEVAELCSVYDVLEGASTVSAGSAPTITASSTSCSSFLPEYRSSSF
nr:MAG TPA: hypothetical protein [Caudoviricetes sp.]